VSSQRLKGYLALKTIPQNKVLVVFDPLVAASYFFERMKKIGVRLVLVFTPLDEVDKEGDVRHAIDAIEQSSTEGEFILKSIQLAGNVAEDVELLQSELKEYSVLAYIAGFEGNLNYIEKVAYELDKDKCNDPATSNYRSTKSGMQQALKAADMPYIKQIKFSDLNSQADKATRAVETLGLPVVVKPSIGGGGGVSVKLCHSKSALIDHVKLILSAPGIYGVKVTEVVAEEFIDGDEYIVDAASYNGQHRITGVFKYEKIVFNDVFLYRSTEMLDCDSKEWHALISFAEGILKALKIKTGLSHIEVKMSSKGLRLIEHNGRISGTAGLINALSVLLTGEDQLSALIESILNYPSEQASRYQYGEIFYLQNFGFKYKALDEELIRALPTYNAHTTLHHQCDTPKQPEDLLDSVMFIMLATNSKEALEADMKKLLEIEKTGQFVAK